MKCLDIQKVFVFKKEGDLITFAIPLNSEDKELVIETVTDDVLNELSSGFDIIRKRVVMFGDTSDISTEVANKLPVEFMWYMNVIDFNNREVNVNDNGYVGIFQYYDKKSMIRLACSMIGNPKEAVILQMKYDNYIASDFYIKLKRSKKYATSN